MQEWPICDRNFVGQVKVTLDLICFDVPAFSLLPTHEPSLCFHCPRGSAIWKYWWFILNVTGQ